MYSYVQPASACTPLSCNRVNVRACSTNQTPPRVCASVCVSSDVAVCVCQHHKRLPSGDVLSSRGPSHRLSLRSSLPPLWLFQGGAQVLRSEEGTCDRGCGMWGVGY